MTCFFSYYLRGHSVEHKDTKLLTSSFERNDSSHFTSLAEGHSHHLLCNKKDYPHLALSVLKNILVNQLFIFCRHVLSIYTNLKSFLHNPSE